MDDDKFVEWRLFRTEEMEQFWTHYVEKYPESAEAMNEAIRKFKAVKLNDDGPSDATFDSLYQKIVEDAQRRRSPKRIVGIYLAAAASIALLITSSLIFFRNNNSPVSPDIAADTFVGKIMPSSEIRLISDEKTMVFAKDAEITVKSDGKITVVEHAGTSELILSANATNRLIVPPGKRSTLRLADGTKMWINSGTELEFPSMFVENTREITVNGEIYIEVANAKGKPFHVNTDRFKVVVLGTKFNISAYADDIEKTVVLTEGSVEVEMPGQETSMLEPNEMLAVNIDKYVKTEVNTSEYTSWKDGILVFNDTPISDVVKQIGRHYNVRFEDYAHNNLSSKTCTGKLFLSDSFDEVMLSLAALSSTIYYKKDNMIYLKDK